MRWVLFMLGALFLASGAGDVAAAPRYIVLQNLNPPYNCMVIPQDRMFIQIYRTIYGPASRTAAMRYARRHCKGARSQ